MYCHKQIDDDAPIFTPLNLLYHAYADHIPTIRQALSEHAQALESCIAPLAENDQQRIIEILCYVCSEKEYLAFLSGVRVGVRLENELSYR